MQLRVLTSRSNEAQQGFLVGALRTIRAGREQGGTGTARQNTDGAEAMECQA